MEQQTNSKAAANAREIIFEHQKDNVIEFNDIYRYITEGTVAKIAALINFLPIFTSDAPHERI